MSISFAPASCGNFIAVVSKSDSSISDFSGLSQPSLLSRASGATGLLENGEDVLEKVELLVARASPEIVTMHDKRLFLFVTGFVDNSDAALLAEQRIAKTMSY
jgi:hypothetical protein